MKDRLCLNFAFLGARLGRRPAATLRRVLAHSRTPITKGHDRKIRQTPITVHDGIPTLQPVIKIEKFEYNPVPRGP
jgi:hypothetical protein